MKLEILTQAQCKAARALLGWTASELAEAAGVSIDTLRSFESGRSKTLNRENEAKIVTALFEAGLDLIPENGGGHGVRLRKGSTSHPL